MRAILAWVGSIADRLKQALNEQASRRLEQLGYTGPMASDAKREAWWWLQARAAAARRRRGLLAGRQVVWTDVGRAELVSVEVPRPGPGEVAVEILFSVVSSGTERAQYLRLPNTTVSYPYRPGYSASGVVVAVGPEVSGFSAGDLVAGRGLPHGSIATVRAETLTPVPRTVRAADAAFLELGIIAGQAVRHGDPRPDEPACVLGAGVVGALIQRRLSAAGAGEVTVVARTAGKEGLARLGGAAGFVALEDEPERIDALAAPLVIDATGDSSVLELAVRAAAPGGRIVLAGSPRAADGCLPVDALREKGLTVIGAHVATLGLLGGPEAYGEEAETFLQLLADGRLSLDGLVSLEVDPRECDDFYRRLASDTELVAGRFAWQRLARDDRLGRSRVARVPELRAPGLELERPRRARMRQPSAALRGPADPFADAVGHLRIGLVGCGDIGAANAAAIATAPNTTLTAHYDPVLPLAEELSARYGGHVARSVDELLDRSDVDAVFVSVPHDLHTPLGLAAVAAGKHVIIEKPPAQSLLAARELVSSAEEAGVALSVCFPHRYQPNVVAARRALELGALGDFRGALLTFFAEKPASYWRVGYSGRTLSDWRSSRERAGGGVLIMNLSHYLDLIRYLSGLETEAVGGFLDVVDGPAEVEDTVSLSLRYENGAVGSLFGCAALRGTRSGRTELHLWGPRGHLRVEPAARLYTLQPLEGVRTGRWESLGTSGGVDIRAVYLARFASAVAEGRPPDITGEDGLAVQAVIEAAYEAGWTGGVVRPADVLEQVAT